MIEPKSEYKNLNKITNNEYERFTDYSPVYNYIKESNSSSVNIYKNKKSYNVYEFEDNSGNKKTGFMKYITLVDYLKYLTGKYKNINTNILPCDDSSYNSTFEQYINDTNNYSYVDSLFYRLSSKLLNDGFVHGLDCYDSFICIKNNCRINIADDFEYISDSNYFNQNLNRLFLFDDENIGKLFNDTKKEKIKIDIDEDISIEYDELLDDEKETTEIDISNEDVKDISLNVIYNPINNVKSDDEEDEESDGDDSEVDDEDDDDEDDDDEDDDDVDEDDDDDEDFDYELSNEDDEEYEEDDDESHDISGDESDDEDSISSDEELEELFLSINKFPTQVVCIEKCHDTFDNLLEKSDIKIEELESAIFQVIVNLYIFQKKYNFTHNDLHTNNIMYIKTDIEYLQYDISGVYYRIPTYGKIFKIIDFGRSIYEYNNKLLCSDSFSENGTAHTQYNFEPFYNKNKPTIKPNYSFDLCRLACSMIDIFIEDIENIKEFRKVPIYDLIISWLYDDNNINILYKRNGEERYPNFKLYKMISRLVHNHIPENQFSHHCFHKYKVDTFTDKETMILNNIINS